MWSEPPLDVLCLSVCVLLHQDFLAVDDVETLRSLLYATALKGSETGEYNITSLAVQDASRVANFHGIIRDVRVLGQEAPVTWTRDAEGLHVHAAPGGEMPVVIKLTID